MKAKTLLICGLSLALLSVTVGCKQPDASRLKTLDNFAAGKRVKTNACSGDPALANLDGLDVVLTSLKQRIDYETKADKAAIERAVTESFAAVPPDVQNLFLMLNGRILVTDNANGVCTDMDRQMAQGMNKTLKSDELAALREDLDKVTSCYLFGTPSLTKRLKGQERQMLTIVVPGLAAEIQHSLVRSVGYLVSNVFSHLIYSEGDGVITWISEENPSFTNKKEEIAAAFLKDVGASSNASRFAKYQAGGAASKVERKSFGSFVYAEAFDSFYCNGHAKDSKNTRKVMVSSFPNTYGAFVGHKTTGTVTAAKIPDGFAANAADTIDVGSISSRPNLQFREKLVVVDWLTEAVKNRKPKSGSGGDSKNKEGFALSGGLLGWASDAWNGTYNAVNETVRGAGVLYNDYSDRVGQATQAAMDQYSAGGRTPTWGQTAMAAVQGVSAGTGYTDYYNNTQRAIDSRISQGQSITQAAFGGVSDTTGYTDKYNEIASRTDNIATQVMSDPSYNTYSPLYKTVLGASTVANAIAPDVSKLPKIGDYVGAAQNFVTAGAGGGFDADGNYKEATSSERWGALGSGLFTVGDKSGFNDAFTSAVTDRGMSVLADAAVSDNRYIRSVAQPVADVVSVVETTKNAYDKALKTNEVYNDLKSVSSAMEPFKVVSDGLTTSSGDSDE